MTSGRSRWISERPIELHPSSAPLEATHFSFSAAGDPMLMSIKTESDLVCSSGIRSTSTDSVDPSVSFARLHFARLLRLERPTGEIGDDHAELDGVDRLGYVHAVAGRQRAHAVLRPAVGGERRGGRESPAGGWKFLQRSRARPRNERPEGPSGPEGPR